MGHDASVIEDRLRELGFTLPPVFPPAGNYLGCVVDGDLVHVGGHGPVNGDRIVTGKVGADLTLEQGREAARMAALSMLATLSAELGGLDRVSRVVKLFGMVNCAPGFNRTPAVIDGASDLLVEIFGDAGRQEVLKAAGLAAARAIVVTNPSLFEKMNVCVAARAVNPRIAIIATADSPAERVWLEEFGAEYVCDVLSDTTEGLMRAMRSSL